MIHIHVPAQASRLALEVGFLVFLLCLALIAAAGRNVLMKLFGKTFYKFEGRQFIKEQKYLVMLDIIVAQDSISECAEQTSQLNKQLEETEDNKLKRGLRAQIDGYEQQLIQVRNKLLEHHQKLENLEYKKQLISRL